MSLGSSKASVRGKATRPERQSQSQLSTSDVVGSGTLELLPYVRGSLETGKELSAKAREALETVRSELRPWVPEEDPETYDPEAAQSALYNEVNSAVQSADSQIDKLCFKRRPSPPADAKKGVTAALEQLAEEVWKAVAEGMEKPLALLVARMFPVLDSLADTIEALSRTLDETISHVEAGQPSAEAPPYQGEPQDRSKPPDSETAAVLRAELEAITSNLQGLTVSKGKNEDPEIGKIRREVGKIKAKVQNLSRMLEEEDLKNAEEKSGRRSNVTGAGLSDDIEIQSEHSQIVLHPPSQVTIDAEEIKNELSRHLRDNHANVITALNEQKQDISSVAQAQVTLQSKQDALTMEVAELRKKLNEVFSVETSSPKGKKVEMGRSVSFLRAFAPHIRANSEQEFVEKFSKQIADERAELDSFLSLLRSEGISFLTLDDLAREFIKLKTSVTNLQEEREDALLKMIRVQSEFEIEMQFQKAKTSKLEAELSEMRSSGLNTEEISTLRSRIDELTLENARLRGDALDLSSVGRPSESIDDYSKNDELAFLKLQLHQKKERLAKFMEERKGMGSRAPTPTEIMTVSEKCDREAADIKRLTRQIQTIEGSQDVADSLGTRELEMKPVDEHLASHIMTLLNLTGAFEICGTVAYGEDVWALVKVAQGIVWVRTNLDRYKLSNEEMIVQCTQATKLLEAYPNLPRSVVLALGQLISRNEGK